MMSFVEEKSASTVNLQSFRYPTKICNLIYRTINS